MISHYSRLTLCLHLLAGLTASISLQAGDELRFVSVSPENTLLMDGAAIMKSQEDSAWEWAPDEGNGGLLKTTGAPTEASMPLVMTIEGLQAGQLYEVHGLFWAKGDPDAAATADAHHAVQLGLSLASMQPFDGLRSDGLVKKEPWVVTPNYRTGSGFGLSSSIEKHDTLAGMPELIDVKGDMHLIRARLDCSSADDKGRLPVFIAASAFRSRGDAMVDGVVLKPAAPKDALNPYLKSKSRLHLAIRAGDSVSIERELAAKADLNGLDEEGLTPLFMATASGDATLVEKLLKLGARPEHEGQSISPLTAAATLADPKLVEALLKAGAQLPLSPPSDKGRLANDIDPSCLHPVIAAIHSGSVTVLRKLLESRPQFDLKEFTADLQGKPNHQMPRINSSRLVDESIKLGHWDMAAHLIDQGLPVQAGNLSGERRLLSAVASAGPDADPCMEALLKRGEAMIAEKQYNSNDVLNTAAWMGRLDLVRRFLPSATDVGPYYKNSLLERAMASGNRDIVELVRTQFPDAQVSRWKPEDNKPAISPLDTDSRLFLPRTSPPSDTTRPGPLGKHTLAVLSSPEAAAVGDMLSLHASRDANWQVVDREDIEAALLEDRFSKPWQKGEHRLADLGDRLKADCLMVVNTIRINNNSIHRFEVVEVATGLEIHREHIKGDAFVDKTEVGSLLERTTRALATANQGERHHPVTLLNFTSQVRSGNSIANPGLLRASLRRAVDSTPGMISISRAQSAKLIEEQTLGGKNSVWGAAHTLEGAISTSEEDAIKVSLRLESFRDGSTVKTDVEAFGKATELPEIAARAWSQLLDKSGIDAPYDKAPDADPARSLQEGRRLMREADWLHAMKADPQSYLPLIESAIALGIPEKESILIHLDGCFREVLSLRSERESRNEKNKACILGSFNQSIPGEYNPVSASDQLAHQLPAARHMLHQASWYLERMGSEGLDGGTDWGQEHGIYRNNEIWHAIQALSVIESRIIPEEIPQPLRAEYADFSIELEELTRRYFEMLMEIPKPDPYRYYPTALDIRMIQCNPALLEGFIKLSREGAYLKAMLPERTTTGLGYSKRFEWFWLRKKIAREILKTFDTEPPASLAVTKADLECFVANPAERSSALRELIEACAASRWHIQPTRMMNDEFLLSQEIIDASTTSHFYERPPRNGSLSHDASMIPAVLFSERTSPDYRIRFNTYHQIFHILNQRRGWAEDKLPASMDPFRQYIQGYYSWELSRLTKLSKDKRPANATPGQTRGQHGPPGITATREARNSLSLLIGEAKIAGGKASSGGPDLKKKQAGSIKVSLMTDLQIEEHPGTFIWPMVDRADPNLLWVFYFPSANKGIPVNQAGGDGPQDFRHVCQSPWLLGIDCSKASIVRKINLHAETGKAYGLDLSNRTCNVWPMGLAQTDKHILTSVGWHHENYANNKMGSVIIDKKTGRAHPIEGNPEISGDVSCPELDIWNQHNGAVSAGGHFFFVQHASHRNGGAVEGVRTGRKHAIFQITPDLEKRALTVIGRKPELSPFDAVNRSPVAINSNGERLVAIHPSTIAEYDPAEDQWAITASTASDPPTSEHTSPLEDANYWKFLRSIHELSIDGQFTGWMAVSWGLTPGILPIASRTEGGRILKTEGELPEEFRNSAVAIEYINYDTPPTPKRIPIKDHPRFKKLKFTVLAQTEEDLILGVQISNWYGWDHPSRNTHHLPFLWKVSKRKILKRLEPDSAQ